MNLFKKMTFAILFAISSIPCMQAIGISTGKKKHKKSAAKAYQESSTTFQTSLSGLSGQGLIDALNKRNQILSANIADTRKNIQGIHKNIGKHSVIIHGKSKSRLNKASKQQAQELADNHKAISLDTQEINHNNIMITQAQKALNQAVAMTAQNQLTQYLQQNGKITSNNGLLNPTLQTALNNALQASYAQGQSDQSATDATAIQNAYNQGYSDAQNSTTNGSLNSSSSACDDQSTPSMQCNDGTAPSASNVCDDQSTPTMLCDDGSTPNSTVTSATSATSATPATSATSNACYDSSTPSMQCQDGSTPSASNSCSDGSTATMLCADGSVPGSTPAPYVSSCDDGSNAICSDATNILQATCDDGSTPDINGMCADGTLITCKNAQSPTCADGTQPQ